MWARIEAALLWLVHVSVVRVSEGKRKGYELVTPGKGSGKILGILYQHGKAMQMRSP